VVELLALAPGAVGPGLRAVVRVCAAGLCGRLLHRPEPASRVSAVLCACRQVDPAVWWGQPVGDDWHPPGPQPRPRLRTRGDLRLSSGPAL